MPTAGDAYLQSGQTLPAPNNPLNRLQLGSFSNVFDPIKILEQWVQWFETYGFQAIEQITGIDLSAFLPVIDGTLGALTQLFGDLNPLSGTFDPLDAVTTFIDLMVEVGASLPIALIQELTGFTGGIPILSQLIGLFTGATGGLTGLTGLGSIFGDLTGLLGNPTALGSGTPILGAAGSIPVLGPLIEEFVSLLGGAGAGTGLGGLTTIFEDLLGVLGNPTGLGSGTPGLGSLGSIPILGPVLGLFGGATDATQAGNFFSNLLSFLGTPTLTGSTGSFDPVTAAEGFINDILNPTGLLASVTGIVNALTGSAGNLTDLEAFFTDFLGIFGNPTGLGTGSPTLPGVGSIPILGPLFGLFGGASDSTQAGNFFTSITSLFGNPSGMTSGSPTVPALGSIPILGPVFGLFGGATTSTQAGNFVTNLLSILNSPTGLTSGSFDPLTAGVSLLDDFLPGLTGANGLFNGLFGGITKLGGTGRTRDEVNTAVAGQADTVIGTASTMEQILAALGSGTPDSDDFERTSSSSLGANWSVTQTGSGTLATPNGHDANFSGSGSVEYVARKTDKQASTDHQTVTMVFATGIPSYPFFTPLPYGGNNDLWVRMNGFTTFATRTGLRLRVNGNAPYGATWYIHWVNSGSETQLATGSMSIPAAGASISFEVGVGGDMRHYAARLNGTTIAGSDFTDSTDRGLGNHYRGLGGKGATGIGTPQGTANLKQWTAQG